MMFESYFDNNHQMNIPEDDVFLKGIGIVQYPLINDPQTKQDHWNERINKDTKEPTEIDQLIIHCSFEPHIEKVLSSKVASAHYVIHKDGTILQCVDESKRAYHAGVLASWVDILGGANNINAHSIGIELENATFGTATDYSPEQMNSLIRLSKSIIARHHIKPHNIIGHSDIAPGRKADPGVLFPWRRLAEMGIGIYPKHTELPDPTMGTDPRKLLESIGYRTKIETVGEDGKTVTVQDKLSLAMRAFKRHFMPFGINDEGPTPKQIQEYKSKDPSKSISNILSDISLDFMIKYESGESADKKKAFVVSASELRRLQVVAHAFQQSRLKARERD